MSLYPNGESERLQTLFARFRSRFQKNPECVLSAPGRVYLMGGPNGAAGRAIVSAVSADLLCAAARREDGLVEIVSDGFDPVRFSVHDLGNREREKGRPVALARGVLEALRRRGYAFGGFSAALHSEIFRGAGFLPAFAALVAKLADSLYFGGKLPPLEAANAAMYSQNVYFGEAAAPPDQAGAVFGGAHYVAYGGSPAAARLPLPKGVAGVFVGLENFAAYDAFRAELERDLRDVAAYFKRDFKAVSLREIEEFLPRMRGAVSDRAIFRALAEFEECDRIDRAAQALSDGNSRAFDRLVRESGESALNLVSGSAQAESFRAAALAVKLIGRHSSAPCRITGGGGVFALAEEGEADGLVSALRRVFGRDAVHIAGLREEGVCELPPEAFGTE